MSEKVQHCEKRNVENRERFQMHEGKEQKVVTTRELEKRPIIREREVEDEENETQQGAHRE